MNEKCQERIITKTYNCNKTGASNKRTHHDISTSQRSVYTSLVLYRSKTCRQHANRYRLQKPLNPWHFPIGTKVVPGHSIQVAILTNLKCSYDLNSTQDMHENPENQPDISVETSIICVARQTVIKPRIQQYVIVTSDADRPIVFENLTFSTSIQELKQPKKSWTSAHIVHFTFLSATSPIARLDSRKT